MPRACWCAGRRKPGRTRYAACRSAPRPAQDRNFSTGPLRHSTNFRRRRCASNSRSALTGSPRSPGQAPGPNPRRHRHFSLGVARPGIHRRTTTRGAERPDRIAQAARRATPCCRQPCSPRTCSRSPSSSCPMRCLPRHRPPSPHTTQRWRAHGHQRRERRGPPRHHVQNRTSSRRLATSAAAAIAAGRFKEQIVPVVI